MVRIMLCDDSKLMLNLLERKFYGAGFDVVGKGQDGEEGFKLFKELRPDLVVLDITMPNRDGRQCMADILKVDPAAKIVILSGLADQSVIDRCLAEGAKAFISKSKFSGGDVFEKEVLPLIQTIMGKAA